MLSPLHNPFPCQIEQKLHLKLANFTHLILPLKIQEKVRRGNKDMRSYLSIKLGSRMRYDYVPNAPLPMRMGETTSHSFVHGLYFSTVFRPSRRKSSVPPIT